MEKEVVRGRRPAKSRERRCCTCSRRRVRYFRREKSSKFVFNCDSEVGFADDQEQVLTFQSNAAGCVFPSMYRTHPISVPSRFSLLTRMVPFKLGLQQVAKDVSWPHVYVESLRLLFRQTLEQQSNGSV